MGPLCFYSGCGKRFNNSFDRRFKGGADDVVLRRLSYRIGRGGKIMIELAAIHRRKSRDVDALLTLIYQTVDEPL